MKRTFRLVVATVAALSLAAGLTLIACSSNTGAPACNALANCCGLVDQGSAESCIETANSGVETDASCGQALAMYVSQGACTPSGGAVPIPDGGAQ